MKKVLVTGGSGLVGRQALPRLEAAGYEVHAVTSRAEPPHMSANELFWHRVDLLDRAETVALLNELRPTHMLHLAWYAVPGKYWTSLENFRWVRASLDLFEAFAASGGERLVAAGTCAEYEWGGDAPCSEATTPLSPATTYGTCKHALRLLLDAFARQTGMSAAWGRIFFLYGPHEYPERLVASVIRALLRGEPARCTHARQVRDVLYVGDVAAAFVALLDSRATGAVNIGSGRPVALREVIYKIADQLDRRDLIELGAVVASPNEPPLLAADVRRLHNEVGWEPEYDLDAGLEETIGWWRHRLAREESGITL